jgi:pimeloyl-ACP methyl ester carboxylesterase
VKYPSHLLPFAAFFLVAAMLPPEVAHSAAGAPVSHTLEVNGIDLHYEITGAGNDLLLLHSGTRTTRMWDGFVERFSKDHRLIAVDLRGHGGSTNPDGVWSTRQFASDVLALLDHLGVTRCTAIGASAGAMTLLHIATREPERIERMIVIGVGTYLNASCRETLSAVTIDDIPEGAWNSLRARHTHGDDQIRALYAWVASLSESYNDMTFTPPYLSTITATTLIVHGDRDYCFPASMAWDIYDAIPSAYLWVVPNGGHVPITGANAAAFSDTAVEFLSGSWEQQ